MVTLTGGDKLQARLREIAEGLSKSSTLSVGFMSDATYPDGTSVALVATVNEFGAPSRGQPPRPFFRNMIAAKSEEWPDAIADLLVKNDYDADRTLGQTGEGIKGQLQQSIADFSEVPLKPETVARKGSDKQLVETGTMLNSVTYSVE
jgi:hypothetical protein